jgi:hypothetical protein
MVSKAMKASDVIVEYLRLSAAERATFDRFYAGRDKLQDLHDLMARIKPEQMERVRAVVKKWKAGLKGDASGAGEVTGASGAKGEAPANDVNGRESGSGGAQAEDASR